MSPVVISADVDCRVWVYQGKEYPIPYKGLFIEAILREVYREPNESTINITRSVVIPENLKNVFLALGKRKKTT